MTTKPIHPSSPPVNSTTLGYPTPKGQPLTKSIPLTSLTSENEAREQTVVSNPEEIGYEQAENTGFMLAMVEGHFDNYRIPSEGIEFGLACSLGA